MKFQWLFPQLTKLTDQLISKQSIHQLSYFKKASLFLPPKAISNCIDKLFMNIKPIQIKRGTLIYATGDNADNVYFLTSGKIELLIKKTSRQKLETYANHTLYGTQQKVSYLRDKFGFQPEVAQKLIELFYQQKILFRYLPFRTLQGEGEFGFGQVLRNSIRSLTAIATMNSQLLVISKEVFDECIRQFQSRKQSIYIEKIVNHFGEECKEQLNNKIPQVMNLAQLKLLEKDDILYQENSATKFMYFIFQGELQLTKSLDLQLPKKYTKNQNKQQPKRNVQLKIIKLSEDSFIGQYEIINFINKRDFTVKCTASTTIILEIQPISFLKAISQCSKAEKIFISNAHNKVDLANDTYEKQSKKLSKTFKNKFVEFQAKQKQAELTPKLREQIDVKNQFYEVFTKNGLFYRDIFQKIQGFDFDNLPKPKSIKKTKIKSVNSPDNSPNPPNAKQQMNTESKILFSPNAPFNQVEYFGKAILTSSDEKKTDSILADTFKRATKSHQKLQQLKKDEQIFKRVLIKHGLYHKDKSIDKSQISKPIINYNFDEIIKQCISRKNPSIRRAQTHRKTQMIKQSYMKTVKNLRTNNQGSFGRISSVSNPCRGTQQMKKRMQAFKNGPRFTPANQAININSSPILQECIGVNSQPKSRDVRYRSTFKNRTKTSQIPQRIVLLNHMMKPITYNSLEI